MKWGLLLTIVLIGCTPIEAPSQPPLPVVAMASCLDQDGAVAYVVERAKPAKVTSHLVGLRAREFVRRINELPPPTDWVADEVIIFSRPENSVALVVLLNRGCVVAQTQAPSALIEALLSPDEGVT